MTTGHFPPRPVEAHILWVSVDESFEVGKAGVAVVAMAWEAGEANLPGLFNDII